MRLCVVTLRQCIRATCSQPGCCAWASAFGLPPRASGSPYLSSSGILSLTLLPPSRVTLSSINESSKSSGRHDQRGPTSTGKGTSPSRWITELPTSSCQAPQREAHLCSATIGAVANAEMDTRDDVELGADVSVCCSCRRGLRSRRAPSSPTRASPSSPPRPPRRLLPDEGTPPKRIRTMSSSSVAVRLSQFCSCRTSIADIEPSQVPVATSPPSKRRNSACGRHALRCEARLEGRV